MVGRRVERGVEVRMVRRECEGEAGEGVVVVGVCTSQLLPSWRSV